MSNWLEEIRERSENIPERFGVVGKHYSEDVSRLLVELDSEREAYADLSHAFQENNEMIEELTAEVERLRAGIALHRQTGMIARGLKDVPKYVQDLWALIDDE